MRFTLRFSWMLLLPVAAAGGADRSPEPAVVASAPAAAASSLSDPDYRLTPRDEVIFEMFNEPDVKTTQRLTGKGELTLPLIGTVHLGGRTLREAEAFIRDRYKELGFFVEPQVMLSVSEYGERFITVLGSVNNPARIPLPIEVESLGVVEAITQAGGFTRIARTDEVQVTRRGQEGRDERMVVNVQALLNAKSRGKNNDFALQPGDVVFVPERLF